MTWGEQKKLVGFDFSDCLIQPIPVQNFESTGPALQNAVSWTLEVISDCMYEIFKMLWYDKHINFCAIDHKSIM